jgi:hypothetical protein
VVVGTEKEAVITRESKLLFPGKLKAGRAELEALMKEAGLWGDVSDLNTSSLNKLVDSGSINAEMVERIRDFGSEEESTRVRLRRRRD